MFWNSGVVGNLHNRNKVKCICVHYVFNCVIYCFNDYLASFKMSCFKYSSNLLKHGWRYENVVF